MPVMMNAIQLSLRRAFLKILMNERFGICGILPQTQRENKGALVAVDKRCGRLHRATRIQRRTGFIGKTLIFHGCGHGRRTGATKELATVTADRAMCAGDRKESGAFRAVAGVMIGRQYAATFYHVRCRGHDMHRGLGT